jgi:hypothetical protein
MKNEIVEYLSKCLYFQHENDEHQHMSHLLQPLPIPEWKWEIISMDFITSFHKNQRQSDLIMVVIDKISKNAHLYL